MASLILILFCLGLYHLFYEGIIAPSERMNLRYKMFALRDELRRIKMDEGVHFKDAIFNELDFAINSSINVLPLFNLLFVAKNIVRQKEDKELLHAIAKRRHLINNCDITRVKEIYADLNKSMTIGLIVNMGGWLPLLLVASIIYLLCTLFNNANKRISKLILLQVDRIVHSKPQEFAHIHLHQDRHALA